MRERGVLARNSWSWRSVIKIAKCPLFRDILLTGRIRIRIRNKTRMVALSILEQDLVAGTCN